MFTIVLLIYLQAGIDVSLAGATVTGQHPSRPDCEAHAVRQRRPLPVPPGYHAAWQDALCIPIHRDVHVGNERVTAFEKLLHGALQPPDPRQDAVPIP